MNDNNVTNALLAQLLMNPPGGHATGLRSLSTDL